MHGKFKAIIVSLVQEGKVGNLTVAEPNKYLGHNNLTQTGKKADKVSTKFD